MPSLTIPEHQRDGFTKLLRLDNTQFDELLWAVRDAPLKFYRTGLLESLKERVKSIPSDVLTEIVKTLWAMANVRASADALFLERMFHAPVSQELVAEWKESRRARCHDITEAQRVFAALADKWREETALVSATSQVVMNSHYQQIIGLGRTAVPMILRELRRTPDHWFWALASITRENPVNKADAGDLKNMTRAWLQWGKDRGLVE